MPSKPAADAELLVNGFAGPDGSLFHGAAFQGPHAEADGQVEIQTAPMAHDFALSEMAGQTR